MDSHSLQGKIDLDSIKCWATLVFLTFKDGKWKKQKQRSGKLHSGKSKFRQQKDKKEMIEKLPFECSECRYSIMFVLE